jgi:hypothetical protein
MNPEKFVKALKIINSASMKGLIRAFENPPGKTPAQKYVKVSNLLKNFGEEDKKIFIEALNIASEQAIYNFLLVLDGLLAFESSRPKGKLELIYSDGISNITLNTPDCEPLSTLFKSEE